VVFGQYGVNWDTVGPGEFAAAIPSLRVRLLLLPHAPATARAPRSSRCRMPNSQRKVTTPRNGSDLSARLHQNSRSEYLIGRNGQSDGKSAQPRHNEPYAR
jgi:hypothetical protein